MKTLCKTIFLLTVAVVCLCDGARAADQTNRRQSRMMRWDAENRHLIIEKWVFADPVLMVKIAPMP